MLKRLWLWFAQATAVAVAMLFVVATLRPEWLPRGAAPLSSSTPERAQLRPLPAVSGERAGAVASYADAVSRALPSVVSIYTTKEIRRPAFDDPLFERFFGERFRGQAERVTGLGSGVIVTADGYVITNNHVVQAADEIQVALADGRRLEAKVVGLDPDTDLAVLRIEAPNLPAVALGRDENLRVGDVVLAIGNPFNVGQTVTMGIVSALGRTGLELSRYENYIQTDAAINQGNSGGALVDSQGNLVGINTAIFSRTGGSIGIGFAIPASTVTQVMEQLIKAGKVVRGYFGVEPIDITPELVEALKLSRKEGVLVRGVDRSAPAGKAGMEPGDIILTIDEQPVRDTPGMLNQIARLTPGQSARVRVLRKDKELAIAVTVGERPTVPPRK
jgi:serine protease DegQ